MPSSPVGFVTCVQILLFVAPELVRPCTTIDGPSSEQAVLLQGVVREKDTGAAIAGAKLEISTAYSRQSAVTDEAGKYECHLQPGLVFARLASAPNEFLVPVQVFSGPVVVPAGVEEHALPPIELVRGGRVRGMVLDRAGNPVAGAVVQASYFMTEGSIAHHRRSTATTDEQGQYLLEGLNTRVGVWLEASSKEACTAEPQFVRGEVTDPVPLHLDAIATVELSGRVFDTAGRPVANAAVEIWSQTRVPAGWAENTTLVLFDGQTQLRTDARGDFRAPRRLAGGHHEYRAVASADGMVAARTVWVTPAEAGATKLPDLVLSRLRTLEGRVIDSRGEPVLGATVFQSGHGVERTQTTSERDGRFRLPGVVAGSVFLFVDKPGYHFQGQLIGAKTSVPELVLTETGAPASRPTQKMQPVLSPREEVQLARRLLDLYMDETLTMDREHERSAALRYLARVDPERVLEKLEKKAFELPQYNDIVRRAVARNLAAESLAEARTVAESVQDAAHRAWSSIDLCDALPRLERTEKIKLLSSALFNARSIPSPEDRVQCFAGIGRRLLDLGEREKAERLLREGFSIAQKASLEGNGDNARGALAEQLSQIDLPAALELTEGLKDVEERYYCIFANRVAATNAAEAERLLRLVPEPRRRHRYSVMVAARMASADLDQARRIANQISDPYFRAQAYGAMARTVAHSNGAAAKQLVGEAFELLRQLADAKEERFVGDRSATAVAAALLPAVEEIDPERLPEFFWRAISFRLPLFHEAHHTDEDINQLSNCGLAMMLARYNRQIARAVLEPVARQLPTFASSDLLEFSALFAAATLIDPGWAIELIDRVPDLPTLGRANPRHTALLAVGEALTLTGEKRWRWAQHRFLLLWNVDQDDPWFEFFF